MYEPLDNEEVFINVLFKRTEPEEYTFPTKSVIVKELDASESVSNVMDSCAGFG